jgi:hypothetical protein
MPARTRSDFPERDVLPKIGGNPFSRRQSLSAVMVHNRSAHEPSHLRAPANLADVDLEDRALLDGICKLPGGKWAILGQESPSAHFPPVSLSHFVSRLPSALHVPVPPSPSSMRRPALPRLFQCRSSKVSATLGERVHLLRAAANARRGAICADPEADSEVPS